MPHPVVHGGQTMARQP